MLINSKDFNKYANSTNQFLVLTNLKQIQEFSSLGPWSRGAKVASCLFSSKGVVVRLSGPTQECKNHFTTFAIIQVAIRAYGAPRSDPSAINLSARPTL